MILKQYKSTIKELKSMILASRYKAAALANKELLLLYFSVGELISIKSREGKWGAGILAQLSDDLQKELPGLRGFGITNIKRMRLFYEAWSEEFVIRPLLTDELGETKKTTKNRTNSASSIRPLPTDELGKLKRNTKSKTKTESVIRPLLTDELASAFALISFSHHSEILARTKEKNERLFYIQQTSLNFWSVTTLKYQIDAKLYKKRGKLPNNFQKAITNETLREKALQVFKDEYLLDYVNLEDPDFADEKEFENEIVRNIRKFILTVGTDFAFIGNQYRLVVEEEEFFVDLLFFNRKLQSLVAFELKKGKFKPEYLGKMNMYLSALDDMVKQPHENPSIGIILCKSKTNKVVEYAFRDFNKAMGVATYKTSKVLPSKFKGVLPDEKSLLKLLK
jgi:predicted nuclease of restriction endonuclease-like (RecB) superfamily